MTTQKNTGRAVGGGGANTKPGGNILSASSPLSAQKPEDESRKSPNRIFDVAQTSDVLSPSKAGRTGRLNAVEQGFIAAGSGSSKEALPKKNAQNTSTRTGASSSVRAKDQSDLAERNRKKAQGARDADQEDMAVPGETEAQKKKRLAREAERKEKDDDEKKKKDDDEKKKEDEKKKKEDEKKKKKDDGKKSGK